MSVLKKIKNGFLTTFIIWRDEIGKVYKDLGVLMFFVVAPLGYPLIYSYIYNNEIVEEVTAVVVDNCDTKQSREFRRMVDASQGVNIVGVCANKQEAEEAVRRHEAYGIIEIPSDFSKKIASYEQATVLLYADMGSLLYYKSLALAVSNASIDMCADISTQRAGNYTEREDEILTSPMKVNEVAMFNPQGGYASFLIPPVLILILQQMMILGIGMAAGTEKEKGGRLVPCKKYYLGTLRIVFGKSLCYFMVWAIMAVYLLWLIPVIFKLPQEGNQLDVIAFAAPFVLSSMYFGMTVGALVRERENTFMIFVCTSVVLLFMSGVSWPQSAMPEFWKTVALAFPSTPAIQGYVKINTMGATLSQVSTEYMTLWIQMIVYFILTTLIYRKEVKKSMEAYYKK